MSSTPSCTSYILLSIKIACIDVFMHLQVLHTPMCFYLCHCFSGVVKFQHVCDVSGYTDDLTVGVVIGNVNTVLLCVMMYHNRFGVGIQYNTH